MTTIAKRPKEVKLDYSIPREQVPEPDSMVKWTIVGNDRVASRVIPHVAHYTESWHYDEPSGDLIMYCRDYADYQNPKYAERKFPNGVPLQRWDSKKCTCAQCSGGSLRIVGTI